MNMGHSLNETEIKRGLTELNSGVHFDVGGNLNLAHPMQNIRQGVWYYGEHICSMDREMVPEFKVWSLCKRYDLKTKTMVQSREMILRIGWRDTFEHLIRARIAGITHESIAAKFNVPIKRHVGPEDDLYYDQADKDTEQIAEKSPIIVTA